MFVDRDSNFKKRSWSNNFFVFSIHTSQKITGDEKSS